MYDIVLWYLPFTLTTTATTTANTTTTTSTTLLRPFVWDYPGEPILEEAFTHSHLS